MCASASSLARTQPAAHENARSERYMCPMFGLTQHHQAFSRSRVGESTIQHHHRERSGIWVSNQKGCGKLSGIGSSQSVSRSDGGNIYDLVRVVRYALRPLQKLHPLAAVQRTLARAPFDRRGQLDACERPQRNLWILLQPLLRQLTAGSRTSSGRSAEASQNLKNDPHGRRVAQTSDQRRAQPAAALRVATSIRRAPFRIIPASASRFTRSLSRPRAAPATPIRRATGTPRSKICTSLPR